MEAPEALARRLEAALGAGALSTAAGALTAFPESEGALAEVVRLCRETRTPLVPAGGRTLMDVGGPPPPGALFVSLARFNALVEHDDANLTVTVGAGMAVRELQQTLGARGQFAALDPPWPEKATVGGVVAVNLNGFRRAGYRSIRDMVIGMRVVTGKGEVVKAGGKVVKNVAGYDMCKLFVGSLGTLGVITEITARVEPLPEADVTLVVGGEPAELLSLAQGVAHSNLLPTAVVLLNGAAATALRAAPGPAALVRLEGFEAVVPRQEREVAALTRADVQRLAGAAHARAWAAVHRLGWEGRDALVRLMVPRSRLAEVWEHLMPSATLGAAAADVMSGTIWVTLAEDTPAQRIAAVTALAERAGGHFLMARLPSTAPVPNRWAPVPNTLPLMRTLKQALDPDGILNPGRFLL